MKKHNSNIAKLSGWYFHFLSWAVLALLLPFSSFGETGVTMSGLLFEQRANGYYDYPYFYTLGKTPLPVTSKMRADNPNEVRSWQHPYPGLIAGALAKSYYDYDYATYVACVTNVNETSEIRGGIRILRYADNGALAPVQNAEHYLWYDNDQTRTWHYSVDKVVDMEVHVPFSGTTNVYVTGICHRTDGGAGHQIITVCFVNGITQWSSIVEGDDQNGDCYPVGIKVVKYAGGARVYVAGSAKWSETGYDYVVIRYEGTGCNPKMAHFNHETSLDDFAYAMTMDGTSTYAENETIYVTGKTVDSVGPKIFTLKCRADLAPIFLRPAPSAMTEAKAYWKFDDAQPNQGWSDECGDRGLSQNTQNPTTSGSGFLDANDKALSAGQNQSAGIDATGDAVLNLNSPNGWTLRTWVMANNIPGNVTFYNVPLLGDLRSSTPLYKIDMHRYSGSPNYEIYFSKYWDASPGAMFGSSGKFESGVRNS